MKLEQDAFYHFKCLIEKIAERHTVEWEIPYDIREIPADLVKLPDTGIVEYWIIQRDTNRKNKKITRIDKGIVSAMVLHRAILAGLGMAVPEFSDCKEVI